ncbi:MAG TPA: zinc ribbon domain-containing protein [Gammaproteobacteria bacterium]|jgi:putative FmdB family regulatory protein
MPIYEYGCRSCGHTLDALQKISDKVLRKCPECGKPALKRLMSAPAFRLKGGGWYETDFKADGEKKRNLAETGASKDEAKSKDDAKAKEGKTDASADKKAPSAASDKKKSKGAAKSAAKSAPSEAA